MFVTHGSAQPPFTPETFHGVEFGMLHHFVPLRWNNALQRPVPSTQSAMPSAQPSFSLTNVRSRTATSRSGSALADVVGGATTFGVLDSVPVGFAGDCSTDPLCVPGVGPCAEVCRLCTPTIPATTAATAAAATSGIDQVRQPRGERDSPFGGVDDPLGEQVAARRLARMSLEARPQFTGDRVVLELVTHVKTPQSSGRAGRPARG